MNVQGNHLQTEGICPKCHQNMERKSSNDCYCKTCQISYRESYQCPTCNSTLNQIKGCGAINYLCPNDGLVSSSKVVFHYHKQSN